MKSHLKYYLIFLSCFCIYGKCNKTKIPQVIAPAIIDIKTKNLTELKSFLDGNWQMHYMISEIYGGGKEKTILNDCFFKFFPADSVKWTLIEPPLRLLALNKLQYIPTQNLYPGTGFNLLFRDIYNQERFMVPDKTIGDTLVLFEDGIKTNYFLTRK